MTHLRCRIERACPFRVEGSDANSHSELREHETDHREILGVPDSNAAAQVLELERISHITRLRRRKFVNGKWLAA